ncbi:bacitracin transport system permease protein [Natronobacillus azotifigens]|uniref:FtsX-like permease family protein n=1 Tax=Natronobacillus azotifigens TaxID=472978 RepID=A0A9J6RFL7_9BACI|nr:FtsX-like permease family protein [Natronobacillus azotifigens]MCZ0704400.1 FtsX-like permease family protein [Natronobacillus azotifigens]
MSINRLIIQNLKQNVKNYYLYVLALIFSVALYFSFVTLQYDPSMDRASGSIRGEAGIRSASVLLFVIVAVFLLYANRIFIKRLSQEIGLFQLIGMNKKQIFRVLTIENSILYFSSLAFGIGIGFISSKLIMMILYKITGVDDVASLHFSIEALQQTLIIFCIVFVCICFTNYLFILKNTILQLFTVLKSTEHRVKRFAWLEVIIGLLGLLSIGSGYYVSQRLFDGDFTGINHLFLAMIFILSSVIIGTYFFFKGTVSFILNMMRKYRRGYLTINHVLSLSSLMFRMKSNALLLTIVTTVSALSIGLLSLSYITYYSAEKTAMQNVAGDFSFTTEQTADLFTNTLEEANIPFQRIQRDVIYVEADVEAIAETEFAQQNIEEMPLILPVVSAEQVENLDLVEGETRFAGASVLMETMLTLKDEGEISWITPEATIDQHFSGREKTTILSYLFTNGGLPVGIVNQNTFEQLQVYQDEDLQVDYNVFFAVNITNRSQLDDANKLFNHLIDEFEAESGPLSLVEMSQDQKESMGLVMFIVGFLGLTFLITSGCILYFKQMDESEDEKANYTILRKIGYTKHDLIKGIRIKQIFNFGIPLILGLSHSYFAVKSGWFFFGTELWTPMLIVMVIYTILYSGFGLLSVSYYKEVINKSL